MGLGQITHYGTSVECGQLNCCCVLLRPKTTTVLKGRVMTYQNPADSKLPNSETVNQGTESPSIEDRRFEYFPIGQKLVCKSCQAEWTDVKPNDVDQVLTDHIGSCTGVGS